MAHTDLLRSRTVHRLPYLRRPCRRALRLLQSPLQAQIKAGCDNILAEEPGVRPMLETEPRQGQQKHGLYTLKAIMQRKSV